MKRLGRERSHYHTIRRLAGLNAAVGPHVTLPAHPYGCTFSDMAAAEGVTSISESYDKSINRFINDGDGKLPLGSI